MAIKHLNGKRLTQAIGASSQRVMEVQERLNLINVFPVPDGDTGTNMALTLRSVAEDIRNRELQDLQFIISHANALESAKKLSKKIQEQFPTAWTKVLPASPTVGTHVGPGACAISYLGFPLGEKPWS